MPSWVIIGASRGTGYQYLKSLSQDPSNTIFGIVRTMSSTQANVDADSLSNVHIVQGDLENATSLKQAAEEISRLAKGAVDYLVVNGAYYSIKTEPMSPGAFEGKEDLFLSEMNKSIITNVVGVLFSINAFISLVKKSEIKKVIAISSAAADVEANVKSEKADGIPYSISKAGVNLLIAKYSIAYKNEEVKFLALNPGLVLTMVDDPENIPPELVGMLDHFATLSRKLNPDFEGPMMPEKSVEMQLKAIDNLTMEQSGDFLGHYGDKRWV